MLKPEDPATQRAMRLMISDEKSKIPFRSLRRDFLVASSRAATLSLPILGLDWISQVANATEEDLVTSLQAETDSRSNGAFTVRAELSVQGNLHLPENALVSKKLAARIPIRSSATFEYVEQPIFFSNQTPGLSAGVARRYTTAAATTTIHQTEYEVKLRSTLNEVTAIRDGTRHIVFSDQGPLSREELDLLKLPVPSSQIDNFLPANLEDLEVSSTYTLYQDALAQAFQLGEITTSGVRGTIRSVSDELIQIELRGDLTGRSELAKTDLELVGKLNFDRVNQSCNWLAIGIREQREISAAEPGFDLAATLKIQKLPTSQTIGEKPQVSLNGGEIAASKLLLEQRSDHQNFQIQIDRSWYMISDVPGISTIRKIENDQVIAQCDFRKPPTLPDDKRYSIEAFQAEIVQKLGEQLRDLIEVQISTLETTDLLRVVADGAAEGIPIRWVFLHFSDSLGRRLIATFTMEAGLGDIFADSDVKIAKSLRFTEARTKNSGAFVGQNE